MEIRWAKLAVRDLERIHRYIAKDSPAAAGDVIQTLYDGCTALGTFPDRGRPSRTMGRRELVFSALPYIAVYRIRLEAVEIIRIYHSAQDWP
jgi:toxin ParE1/3/4